ncbi:hypothetical protein DMB95_08820 [Campylobacter sp. MIT 12-8780]|uniref:hypothetical protein n=1 Tax=unclassified Campylobacter TaxID=2593542 RepID=UPI00115D7F47|nr:MULTISPECIES: hypothetical protein [unclassified Campylobacter]NDJ27945.1 hypothetical protein [Campylobacter sp. MIT 19-121]TQR40123.1 hypothetical protein DMB95_08820 [Campylobacter sp. MIT 12-8780]
MIYLCTNKLSNSYKIAIAKGLSKEKEESFKHALAYFINVQSDTFSFQEAYKKLYACLKFILLENLSKGYHQVLILFTALKAIISEFTNSFKVSFIELYEQIIPKH